MSTIKFGISGFDRSAKDIVLLARTMEDLGFDALWWGEHAIVPKGEHESPVIKQMLHGQTHLTDPLLALAAVSQVTTTLKLGTAIILAPLMHPLTLARATSTMYDLLGDRFLCGLGGGWLDAEFNAMGVPFTERGKRLDDAIAVLRKAWAGGAFEHRSAYFDIPRVQITAHATPVTLIVGGHSNSALQRAAQVGDGWIYSAPMEAGKVKLLHSRLQSALADADRDLRTFKIYVPAASAAIQDVDALVASGFTNIILSADDVWPKHLNDADKIAHLQRCAASLGLT